MSEGSALESWSDRWPTSSPTAEPGNLPRHWLRLRRVPGHPLCINRRKYANELLISTRLKPQSSASLRVSAHTAPSVLLPDLDSLGFRFLPTREASITGVKSAMCLFVLLIFVFFFIYLISVMTRHLLKLLQMFVVLKRRF